jgi:hypothetical protein
MPKSAFIGFANSLPNVTGTSLEARSEEMTIKGKSDGRSDFTHMLIPRAIPSITSSALRNARISINILVKQKATLPSDISSSIYFERLLGIAKSCFAVIKKAPST